MSINFETIELHDNKSGASRKCIIFNGIPFYQSSGKNSDMPGTWEPFFGIVEDAFCPADGNPDNIFEQVGTLIKPSHLDQSKKDIEDLKKYADIFHLEGDIPYERFGSLAGMLYSSALGGGIWETPNGLALKSQLIKDYPTFYAQYGIKENTDKIDIVLNVIEVIKVETKNKVESYKKINDYLKNKLNTYSVLDVAEKIPSFTPHTQSHFDKLVLLTIDPKIPDQEIIDYISKLDENDKEQLKSQVTRRQRNLLHLAFIHNRKDLSSHLQKLGFDNNINDLSGKNASQYELCYRPKEVLQTSSVLDKKSAVPVASPAQQDQSPLPMPAQVSTSSTHDDIAKSVGNFSNYSGLNLKPIKEGESRAYLAKEMLKTLTPKEDWEKSKVTELSKPLKDQEDEQIVIQASTETTKASFGDGKATISKETLKKLSDSAKITTSEGVIPKELYLKIQTELRSKSKIEKSEAKSLADILGNDRLNAWRKEYASLGFSTEAEFDAAAQIPLNQLGMGICHSQEVHFFVEQEIDTEGMALNKLRNVNLDNATPTVLLSTPGLDLRNIKPEDFDPESSKKMITAMWQGVLTSAVNSNCRVLSMPAIGLGAFLPPKFHAKRKEIATLYFNSLMELLSKPEYQGKFDNIYFNPVFKDVKEAFQECKDKHPDVNNVIKEFSGDVKFLAVEFAKKDIRCGLLNPSNTDVMWGINDVGEHYKEGGYVGEEDIAATSTASLGSSGICDAYTNPDKIINAKKVISAQDVTVQTPERQNKNNQAKAENNAAPKKQGIKFAIGAIKNKFSHEPVRLADNQLPVVMLGKSKKDAGFPIAPFKSNKGPYGEFINTTPVNGEKPLNVEQNQFSFVENGEIKKIEIPQIEGVTKNGAINWPSSEHAYHGQKLLEYRRMLQADADQDPRAKDDIKLIDGMIHELIHKLPPLEKRAYLDPRKDFEPFLRKHLADFKTLENESDKYAAFRKKSKSDGYDDKGNVVAQGYPETPYTKIFMRQVLEDKLNTHPHLKKRAVEMAIQGVMPVEISQHDKVWATGKDGSGKNLLGITLLEVANEFVTKENKGTPRIINPTEHYKQIKKQHEKELAHKKMLKYVSNSNPKMEIYKPQVPATTVAPTPSAINVMPQQSVPIVENSNESSASVHGSTPKSTEEKFDDLLEEIPSLFQPQQAVKLPINDVKVLYNVASDLLFEFIRSKEFEALKEDKKSELLQKIKALQIINEGLNNFGLAEPGVRDSFLTQMNNQLQKSELNVNYGENPYQFLSQEMRKVAESIYPIMPNSISDRLTSDIDMNAQLLAKEANLTWEKVTSTPSLSQSTSETSKIQSNTNRGSYDINIKEKYDKQRVSISTNTPPHGKKIVHSFKVTAARTFGDLRTGSLRENQIAALQELVDKVKNGKSEDRNQNIFKLFCALDYLSQETDKKKKHYLVQSALNTVCKDLMKEIEKDIKISPSDQSKKLGKEIIAEIEKNKELKERVSKRQKK